MGVTAGGVLLSELRTLGLLQKNDLVRVKKEPYRVGVLLERASTVIYWNVLIEGEIKRFKESELEHVQEES